MFTVPRDPFADGIVSGFAILFAAALVLRRARMRGFDEALVYRACIAGVIGGLCGGHALHVALHGGSWLRFWDEQSVFGVFAGGGLAALIYLRYRAADAIAHADLAAPAVAAGYGLARVGCFLNGDDFGAITSLPLGVRYLPDTHAWQAHASRGWIDADAAASLTVLPVQLLMAFCALAIAASLWRRALPRGATIGAAALMYGAIRVATEPLRDDFTAFIGPFALPQLCGVLLMCAGVALLLRAYAPRAVPQPLGVRA